VVKNSGIALAAKFLPTSPPPASAGDNVTKLIRLNLNENALGPSPNVEPAIRRELPLLSRYADDPAAQLFAQQIAAYERVPVEQVVLGEILDALGLYLGSHGGPGGEFIYSTFLLSLQRSMRKPEPSTSSTPTIQVEPSTAMLPSNAFCARSHSALR
jgi:histidinol-phosphate aminotransferase